MTSVTSELFEFNKMIFIYLVTIIIGFLWLLKMIVVNKIIIKKTPFDIPIILFLLSQLISIGLSIDRHTSIFGYYGRFNGGILSLIAYIVLFYGLISNFPALGEIFRNKLLKISLVSSLLVIVWGLPGRFGYDLSCWIFVGQINNSCWTNQFRPAERMFSTLGQPNWLGAYLAINFFIGLYFLLIGSKKKFFILYSLYLILNFSAILFTRSRSAYLALIVGVCFYALYKFIPLIKFKSRFKKEMLQTSVFICFVIIIPILLFKTGISQIDKWISLETYIRSRVSHLDKVNKLETTDQKAVPVLDVSESSDIRKIVWQGAWELGKKYPFFGTGPETFAYSYYFVRPIEHNLTSEWDYLYNKAHNEFLNYLATTGYIGLGTYLILIGSVIVWGLKKFKIQSAKFKVTIRNSQSENYQQIAINNKHLLSICLLLAYLSILITNFFGFSTTTINLYFYLIPALIFVNYLDKNNQSRKESTNQDLSLNQKLFFGFILLTTCWLLVATIRYWLADTNYAKGDNQYKLGNYQEAANQITKALKLKYEHVYEDKLSYILANLAFIGSYQKQEEISKQLETLSRHYNQKSLKASPKNVLYWKTTAKNAYLFYQIDLDIKKIEVGIQALQVAEKLAPTDPKIPYSQAIFYSLMVDNGTDFGQSEKFRSYSIDLINRSIKLKPNDSSYYLLKGQLLKKYGDRREARDAFQYILDNFNPDDEEVKKEINSL